MKITQNVILRLVSHLDYELTCEVMSKCSITRCEIFRRKFTTKLFPTDKVVNSVT